MRWMRLRLWFLIWLAPGCHSRHVALTALPLARSILDERCRRRSEAAPAGSAPFVEIQNMTRDAIEQHILRTGLPIEMLSKTLGALAEAAMDLIALKPSMASKYRNAGFEIYWSGIAK